MEAGFFKVIKVDIKISLNPYMGSGFLFLNGICPYVFLCKFGIFINKMTIGLKDTDKLEFLHFYS